MRKGEQDEKKKKGGGGRMNVGFTCLLGIVLASRQDPVPPALHYYSC